MFPLYAQGGLIAPPVILLIALVIDAVIGDPPALWRWIPHPVAIMGGIIDILERLLNRSNLSGWMRRAWGACLATFLTVLAVALGMAFNELRVTWKWGWAAEAVLVWSLLAQRSLFDHVRAVARALAKGGLKEGRRTVAAIVGRDPESLDEYGVARAAIESCAENFADGVVAPVFWYLLFGAPGLLACKAINTMDSMIGHRNARFKDFGMAAARLDDAVNFIPARLAGILLAVAALFVPRGRPPAAFRVMWRDHGHHASPNSGWPEAAMAGALDVALAGPRRYGGHMERLRWIGEEGRARATIDDIKRALYVMAVACLLEFGLVLAVALAEG